MSSSRSEKRSRISSAKSGAVRALAGDSPASASSPSVPAPLRVGVVGLGRWGLQHLERWRTLERSLAVQLVAVVEPDLARLRALSQRYPALKACRRIIELPPLDLASVTTPISSLAESARALIERGVALLVEKPMATSVEEATRLCTLAGARGLPLAVGYLERFNGVLPIARVSGPLTLTRIGPATPAPLALDRLCHDIDLCAHLWGSSPCFEALRRWEDRAGAQLELTLRDPTNGAIARLRCGVGAPLRQLQLAGRAPLDLAVTPPPPPRDALSHQLSAFTSRCRARQALSTLPRSGGEATLATGEDAQRVLRLLGAAGLLPTAVESEAS